MQLLSYIRKANTNLLYKTLVLLWRKNGDWDIHRTPYTYKLIIAPDVGEFLGLVDGLSLEVLATKLLAALASYEFCNQKKKIHSLLSCFLQD